MACKRKLRSNIYLIGSETSQICGSKLPSNSQVLQVFFYNLRYVNLTVRESARLAIEETVIFWQKAKIPVREQQHCIAKLEALYTEWRNLQKNSSRNSDTQRNKENSFTEKLDDLFDIAHANALSTIKIAEDREFLIAQREKGRPGSLAGVDKIFAEKEKRRLERLEKDYERQAKANQGRSSEVTLPDVTDVKNEEYSDNSEVDCDKPGPSKHQKRGRRNFLTSRLVAALDRCRISDRDSVHILVAVAEALGHDVDDLIINRSSIRRCRERLRSERASELNGDLLVLKQADTLTVHWDGKLLPALVGKEKVDRLPVIVTSNGTEHLLGVPQLLTGKGADIASAVYQLLQEYQLTESIQALCCDTTASNTGRMKGACILLEQKLEKDLLYLPCRHHIYELVLKCAFEVSIGTSSGPDVTLFKRFQHAWSQIDSNLYESGIQDAYVSSKIGGHRDYILQFCLSQLKEKHHREDYRELLELAVIFLGGQPHRGISFRIPGAFHHARWMAKAIYCLKIFLFRGQFRLTPREINSIKDVCIFLVRLYIETWFCCPVAAKAPLQDLNFLKDLYSYKDTHEILSSEALKKFCGHLWYLSAESIALAFYDISVPLETKIELVKAMQQDEDENDEEAASFHTKRIAIQQKDVATYVNQPLQNFASKNTAGFFKRFKIPCEFLKHDPSTWESLEDFQEGLLIVQNLKVVNDTAERGVKLMEEFNSILTKKEDQKQYLLQVVKDYRNKFPDSSKKTLLSTI